MKDVVLILGFLAAWFILSRWLLPALGIPTCMSGQCVAPPAPPASTGSEPPIGLSTDETAEQLGVNRLEVDPLSRERLPTESSRAR